MAAPATQRRDRCPRAGSRQLPAHQSSLTPLPPPSHPPITPAHFTPSSRQLPPPPRPEDPPRGAGAALPPSPPGGPTSWCRGGSLLPPRPEDPPRGAGAAPRSARGAPPPPAAAAAARCRTPSPCPGPTPETRPRSLRPGPRRCNNHVTRVSSRDKGQLHVTRVSPRDKGQLT